MAGILKIMTRPNRGEFKGLLGTLFFMGKTSKGVILAWFEAWITILKSAKSQTFVFNRYA
jgi:hypothetical protein